MYFYLNVHVQYVNKGVRRGIQKLVSATGVYFFYVNYVERSLEYFPFVFWFRNNLWEVKIWMDKAGHDPLSLALSWGHRTYTTWVRLLKHVWTMSLENGKEFNMQWEWHYYVVHILKPRGERGRFCSIQKWGHKIIEVTRNTLYFLHNLHHGKMNLFIFLYYLSILFPFHHRL